MKALTGAERVFKALQLQEPDRVPYFEIGMAPKLTEAILTGSSADDVLEYFDFDAVIEFNAAGSPLPKGYVVETLDASHFRNQWGTIMRVTSENLPHPVEAAIKTEKTSIPGILPTLMSHGDTKGWQSW